MPVQDLPIGTNQDRRVIDGSTAELAIAFVDPYRYGELQPPRRGLYRLQLPCLQADRVFQQPLVDVAAQVVVVPRANPPNPFGVAGNTGLRTRNQLGAACRGFLHQLNASGEGLRPVEGYGWMLDNGDSVRARGVFWHGAMLQRSNALCLAVCREVARTRHHARQLLAQTLAQPA